MKRNFAKRGFTLAEVLIVLGVIGIVAALTIPALMKNWQEERWQVENAVFKNRLFEGLSQMHARQRLSGHTSTANFIGGLKNFMKVTETCDTASQCFTSQFTDGADTVNATDYNDITKFGHGDWSTNVVGLKLVNGANLMLAYNPACNLDPAALGEEVATCSVTALYDTNGNAGPNKIGTDIHPYNFGEAAGGCNPSSCTNCSGAGYSCCNSLCIGPELPASSWQNAHNVCSARGERLPKGGSTTSGRWLANQATHYDDLDPDTEAGKIGKYCANGGTCTTNKAYWLFEEGTGRSDVGCSMFWWDDGGKDGLGRDGFTYCYALKNDTYRMARCVKDNP